jgi:hypothetical protein
MFETLKDYIESTPITNFTRKYHAGVDNINVMPLENILLDDEVSALNKIFAMEYKRDVDQYRTQCTLHHNDDTYKELNKLVDVVQTKFDLELSNHVDARMWHDKEGFYFNPHTDNTAVEISVQIYLNNDAPEYCGTSYFFNGLEKYDNFVNIWTSPYKKGSGYLLINTDTEVHAMCHRVPPGCSRTSLYLNFRRK